MAVLSRRLSIRAIPLLMICLGGCAQVDYYLQAARGQYRIIADREPVADLVESPLTAPELRRQLELAQRLRGYAVERMSLGDNRGFTTYADLGRDYVVWNVVAAPAYSLTPKTWCFPIAGCVAYKGFFNQEDAREEAASLADQEFDVITYGVRAYSTLGWFADPLLNTFIHYPEPDLASIIFHELAHQVVYVRDDSAFNEAFATAVERWLLRDWLRRYGDPAEVDGVLERHRRQAGITAMVLDYRDRLAVAYQEPDREVRKRALFAEMIREYARRSARGEGTPYYDWWFRRPLNNADLLSVATYYHLVPAFTAMLQQAEGDLSVFFDEVRLLAEMPAAERNLLLQERAAPRD